MSLNKKHVLVTRPSPQGEALCYLLEQAGAKAYHIPSLEISPISSSFSLFQPDMAIFISVNAVKYCSLPVFSPNINYFAVGASTAMALMERGVIAQQPAHSDSEGLLLLPDLQVVKGKTIALFTGKGGRTLLEETLNARGAYCRRYEVYERRCARARSTELQKLLKQIPFDYVICTSGESLLCLEEMAGKEKKILFFLPLIVVSERIAALAKQRGFMNISCFSEPFDNESMVFQLEKKQCQR